MHIALNASQALKPHSGAGAYCIQLVQALAAVDRENTYDLFVPAPVEEYASLPAGFRQIVPRTGRSAVLRALGEPTPSCRHLNRLLRQFDRHFTTTPEFVRESYDLVHVLHLQPPRQHRRLPVVYTVHDIIPALVTPWSLLVGRFPSRMLSLEGLRRRWTDAGPLRRAVHLVVGSEQTRLDLTRVFRVPIAKTSIVPYGVDGRLLTYPGDHAVLAAYRLKPGSYLLYFGGHTVRKNVLRMCEAFDGLGSEVTRRCPLVIVGGSEAKVRHRFVRRDGFVFTGPLSRERLPALIHGAYAALYLSLYEGFGLPLLEAAAMGVPTIASNASSIPEVLPGAFVPVSPSAVDDIRAAMVALLADPRWRDRLGRAARKQAEERTWTATARALRDVYDTSSRRLTQRP
jgi:glycosyltransferase involved in cell wall biosynthesis